MKLIPLTLLAMVSLTTTHAQTDASVGLRYPTQKGNFLIGALGSVAYMRSAFNHEGSPYGSPYKLGGSPRFGYFIANNLAVGVELNGNIFKLGDFRMRSAGAGVFARYYFGKGINKDGTLKRLRFFAEGSVSLSSEAYSLYGSSYTRDRVASITPNIGAGINYFVSKKVAIEAGLYCKYITMAHRDNFFNGRETQAGTRIGVQIFLGK